MSEQADAEPLVDVYMTNAVRTSQGPGPGHKRLPAREANLLIGRKLAVAGTEPPRSYQGEAEPSTRRFDDNIAARGSRSDHGLRR